MHATPQTRLQRLGVPPEQVHDESPAHARKDGPSIVPHLGRQHWITDDLPATTATHPTMMTVTMAVVVAALAVGVFAFGLDEQLRIGKHNAGEDVDDDLLADGAVDGAAENGVAAYEPGQKGIVMLLLARRRRMPQQKHARLVDQRKHAQIARVLARGFEDELGLGAEAVEACLLVASLFYPSGIHTRRSGRGISS